MKQPIYYLFALTFLCLPPAWGQTFALTTPATTQNPPGVFAAYNYPPFGHHKLNKKILWGGITAASGACISLAGGIVYSWLGTGDGTTKRPTNTSIQNTGKGILIGGAVVSATGFILMIAGKIEKNRGYGFRIIAPRNNEIGFAYNF